MYNNLNWKFELKVPKKKKNQSVIESKHLDWLNESKEEYNIFSKSNHYVEYTKRKKNLSLGLHPESNSDCLFISQ